ncbi:MAG: hypothetical protein IJR87_03245 [Bacteroidaceae bacterium]|nr:hypothetical protein [Bacteroidaceae bacterium]
MKKIYFLLTALAGVCAMNMQTACSCKNDNPAIYDEETSVVINLDSIVIKPYIHFGASFADVGIYMTENFADYSAENPGSLMVLETEEGITWFKRYVKADRRIEFYFNNDDGRELKMVSYDYFFPMPLEPIMAELERNGFTNKGEVRYDDYNADICYLFLSSDENIEVLLSSWEKDGGSWSLTFQLTDEYDLQHLVNK